MEVSDVLDYLDDHIVGRTTVYDGEILYITDAKEWEHGGIISLDARDHHGPKQVTMGLYEAKALDPVEQAYSTGDLADHVIEDDASFDFALPPWWKEFRDITGHDPRGTFVWAYDEGASICGRPRPLTEQALNALRRFNAETEGSDWPTDDNVASTVYDGDGTRYVRC